MKAKVNWGVLGYARIARLNVLPALARAPNAQLLAIASRDASRLPEVKAESGCERVYADYAELLGDPDIQAVYVPLPNALHKEWVLKALEAGKHVLCEKPLALDAAEVREMVQAAERHKRLLMEAFMYRYTDRSRKVREVVESGALGDIRHINASFRFFLDRPGTIKMKPELGGGALYDVGCYPVNFLGMVTGRRPVRCQAFAQMEQGVDVNLSAVLQYDDGLIANIHCGFNAFGKMHAEIIGTQGSLEIDDTFLDFRGGIRLHTKEGTRIIPIAESDRYRDEIVDFSAAILEGRTPALALDESIRNMEVLEMIRQSLSSAS